MSSRVSFVARRLRGLLVAAVSASALAAAVTAPAHAGAPVSVPVFSGERALELVRQQCALGPRTPGSAGNRALRAMVVEAARRAGLRVSEQRFNVPLGPKGGPVEACNIIVSAGPEGGERLWLAAHYDTRPWADQDPVPARRTEPVPGANDGGSGTAVLLHMIELLGASPPPQGVDLLFLDAEDSGRQHDASGFCHGSRYLAASLGTFGSPLDASRCRGLVLLDMVGKAGARIPQEGYSLALAPEWTAAVFERAASLGLDMFEPVPGRQVYDDHVPFLQAGVPAVDLIDFDDPRWHTTADRPEFLSADSLRQAGRLVADLAYRP